MPLFRFVRLGALALMACCGSLVRAQAPETVPAQVPTPDVLLFTNGDQLTGKLLRAVGGSAIFKSDMAGEVTIPFDKVKELRSGSQFAVLRKNGPVRGAAVDVGAVRMAEKNVEVTRISQGVVTIPAAQVQYVIDRATYDRSVARVAGPLEGWSGAATAGLSLVRGTQTSTTFSASSSLARTIPSVPYLPARNRTLFNIAESYGNQRTPVLPLPAVATPDIVIRTHIFHADLERDEYFHPAAFAFVNAGFDHNFAQGLQLQQVYGAGVGWTPIKNSTQQLDLKADAHYERQTYTVPSLNVNLFGSTFSEVYRRNLPRKVLFTESGAYIASWNNLDAYSSNIMGMLTLPVTRRFGASVTATDNYLNIVPAGYQHNSLQLVMGITYTLP